MAKPWYEKKWVITGLHIAIWALFISSPLLFQQGRPGKAGNRPPDDFRHFMILQTLNNVMRMAVFYLNAFWLVPAALYPRKYLAYAGGFLGFMLLMMGWDYFLFQQLMAPAHYSFRNFFLFNFPVLIFLTLASTAFRFITDQMKEKERKQERETENLKTELSFLRSQVSPHFMFNILNNMVALARKKSDLLEPSLIRLSGLLRYMLYETDTEQVPLEKEIEYLENYIALQRQRFGNHVHIETHIDPVTPGHLIEPMLLIPFVENAFKHGTGLMDESRIDIHLRMKNDTLDFRTRNRYEDQPDAPKDKTSGIGLANVKRRLDLLYQNNYRLGIERKDGWYNVTLELNLQGC